jgi:hypothetical protein
LDRCAGRLDRQAVDRPEQQRDQLAGHRQLRRGRGSHRHAGGAQVVVDANIPTNLGAGTNEDVVLVYRANDIWLLEDSPVKTRLDESSPAGTTNNLAVRLLVFNYFSYSSERYSKSSASIGGTKLVPPTF